MCRPFHISTSLNDPEVRVYSVLKYYVPLASLAAWICSYTVSVRFLASLLPFRWPIHTYQRWSQPLLSLYVFLNPPKLR